MNSVRARYGFVCLALVAIASATSASIAGSGDGHGKSPQGGFYAVLNLVSDGFVPAAHNDPDLRNAWGVAFNPNGFVWVADNKTGVSTLYDGNGVKNSLIVAIPTHAGGAPPGSPTGIVFSSGADFVVRVGTVSGPARFIFATEDGTISGWAPNVDATHAIRVIDNFPSGAIYKGLAFAANGIGHFLYATDFHNNKIDVFDSNFHQIDSTGLFVDTKIPHGYAPFGIQNILGNLYVTYAKQDEDAEDDVAGQGFGFVDVFDANGQLIRRFATRGRLNSPWGLALAPADFGRFSNAVLVGNFGDGRINAFDLSTGAPLGRLRMPGGKPIEIEGLWGIQFGNGLLNQPVNTLFFAAGPGDEEHGLYGRIDPAPGNGSEKDGEDDD
jgi:uncharacterized protein (TIGR03118 family)